MSPVLSRLAPSLVIVSLVGGALGGGCNGCTPPPGETPGGDVCGEGTIDGEDFGIDAAKSELVIVVHKKDAFGCGALHSHVVLAGKATLAYTIDSGSIGDASIKMTVPAAKLAPDAPALRKKYISADEGGETELSEGDIKSITGSVREEVLADDHPDLVFTVTDMSKADGDGTGKLTSEIAGDESTTDVAYTIKKNGDDYEVTGTATIDGAKHGMPRLSLGFCVDPNYDVTFKLHFTPGKTTCKEDGDPDPFEEQFFDDQECATEVGFNEARDVLGPRCMGCHLDPPRGGATVPLITWEDYRVNSARNPEGPLYEAAHEYINLEIGASLTMPPSEYTQLTPEEKATLETWMTTDLGRNLACADDPGPTLFTVTEHVSCDDTPTVGFEDDDGVGNTARGFLESNCMFCHADTTFSPQAPQVGTFDGADFVYDFDAGNLPGLHPYYADGAGNVQSFWEMGVARVLDGSMPPASQVPADDPGFLQYRAWVEAGFTEACP